MRRRPFRLRWIQIDSGARHDRRSDPDRRSPLAGWCRPACLRCNTCLRALVPALSLLLCVVVLVMWVRSHLVYEVFGRITPRSRRGHPPLGVGRLHFARHSLLGQGLLYERAVGPCPRAVPPRLAAARVPAPGNETVGFARYVGTAYTWPGHLHPDVPYNAVPPRTDPRWWRDNYRVWVIPHWFLFLATAALPAWWLKRHPPATWPSPLARRRRAAGLCPKCAYDLRATPGRCPECGSEIAPR
jgi:hypothetical protein